MSSHENVEATDAGIDLWRVQLGNGEIRAMSLDALDDAFQAGTIDEGTPVLAPGAVTWTKLADAAELQRVRHIFPHPVRVYLEMTQNFFKVSVVGFEQPKQNMLDLDIIIRPRQTKTRCAFQCSATCVI